MKIKHKVFLFLENRFVKSVTKIISGTLLGQILVFSFSPILTRLYSPDEFGILTAFTSIVGTLWVLSVLRYDLVLPLIKYKKDIAKMAKFALGLSTLFCTVLFPIVWFQNPSFFTFFTLEAIIPFKWTIPIGIITIAFYFIFHHWLIRLKKFSAISIVKVIQSGGMSVLQVLIGLYSSSGLSLIFGYIGGYFLGLCYQVITLRKSGNLRYLRKIKFKYSLAFAKRYKNFAVFATPASFANIGCITIPPLLFAIVHSPEIAGLFALAQRVLGLPINLLATSISQVFLGEIPQLLREHPAKVKKLFLSVSGGLAIVGFLPIILVAYFASDIFSFIFGEPWRLTGEFVRVLGVMYYVRLITTPISQTLNILEKQHIQLYWDLFRLVGLILIFFYVAKNIVNINTTLILFSGFMAFCYVLHFSICFFFINRVEKTS